MKLVKGSKKSKKQANYKSKKFPKQILFYGDFGSPTGFGNVSKKLIDSWSEKYGEDAYITVFALNNYETEPYEYKHNVNVVPALLTRDPGDTDFYCRLPLLKLINMAAYDVVFFFNDIEVINPMNDHLLKIKEILKEHKQKVFKTIAYFPIDSSPSSEDLTILNSLDEIITYTEYGKSEILKLLPRLELKIKVIPHGVDSELFKDIRHTKELKEFRANKFGDKFVFGTVNRNSARKDIATLIMAFSFFKNKIISEDKYKFIACLYLHLNPEDRAGVNVIKLCERLGLVIGQDVLLPEGFHESKGFPEEELNMLYNCMDIFITTTTAEGWGLTVTEAMAVGIPIICPLHTSLTEITNNGKLLFDSLNDFNKTVFLADGEKVRYKSDPEEVCNSMAHAYINGPLTNNPSRIEHIKNIAKSARKKAISYDWEEIARRFLNIINEQISQIKPI